MPPVEEEYSALLSVLEYFRNTYPDDKDIQNLYSALNSNQPLSTKLNDFRWRWEITPLPIKPYQIDTATLADLRPLLPYLLDREELRLALEKNVTTPLFWGQVRAFFQLDPLSAPQREMMEAIKQLEPDFFKDKHTTFTTTAGEHHLTTESYLLMLGVVPDVKDKLQISTEFVRKLLTKTNLQLIPQLQELKKYSDDNAANHSLSLTLIEDILFYGAQYDLDTRTTSNRKPASDEELDDRVSQLGGLIQSMKTLTADDYSEIDVLVGKKFRPSLEVDSVDSSVTQLEEDKSHQPKYP